HHAQGRQHHHPLEGAGEDELSELGELHPRRRLLDRGHEGQPGDGPGDADAARHVIVDADHVGPQTLVDGIRLRTPEGRRPAMNLPVEIRHNSFLSRYPNPEPPDFLVFARAGWTRTLW